MLSLSCPRPQEVGAQPPRSGLRLKVGELSDVVSGALLSMLAMPNPPKDKSISEVLEVRPQEYPSFYVIPRAVIPVCFFLGRPGDPQPRPL